MAALFLGCTGAQGVGYEGFATATGILGLPVVVSYVVAAVVAVAYGVFLIATAATKRARRVPRLSLRAGLVGNTPSRVWYGLTYVLPPLIAWAASFIFRPTATTQYFAVFWFAAPLTIIACVLIARSYSNRDAKRAVLTGVAPSYELSPDRTWWRRGATWASVNDRVWWNGTAWVHAAAEAPDDALRSPDGNYWWTGSSWCPMPPIPKRTKGAQRPSAATL